MKKIILIAISAASIPAYALPTYEPFTEYASQIALQGTTYTASSNGVPLGTNASGSVSNAIDLATNGLTAPSGENWTALKFGGTTSVTGLDVYVVSNTSIFTSSGLSSILPTTFPGFPASGQSITNLVENPAQPLIWTNGAHPAYSAEPYVVGNSAVLTFAQGITRPASGTKSLFVSYLFNIAQKGQAGSGNVGRYLGFLESSFLVEGLGSGGISNWSTMFNTFPGTCPYFGHGVFNGAPDYIEAPDSSAGKDPASPPSTFPVTYNQAYFIVGEFVFTTGGAIKDTNIVWVNPSVSGFGGPTPPASPLIANPMAITMTDVGGMVLIDRLGSGALGGVGTNYIGNLLLGSTWSYVTGGPEFTNQPGSTLVSIGGNVSLSAAATAANQSVTYQWQKVTGGTTNVLTSGFVNPGGSATVTIVTNANVTTMTLTGLGTGDLGTYQAVATASGTGFALASSQATLANILITSSEPQSVTTNYGGSATFTATVITTNATMSYAWYNGSAILTNGLQPDGTCTVSGAQGTTSGGTLTATLTLTDVTYLEDGNYILYVTNNSDNIVVSTTPATLTVNDPVILTQPPYSVVVPLGGNTTIPVVAAGSGVTYQWYSTTTGQLNNVGDISGVTTPTLTVTNAQPADALVYYVVVNGSSGQPVTSSNTAVYVENTNQLGPFSPTNFPASVAANSTVDYVIFDTANAYTFTPPPGWVDDLSLPVSGGDQTWTTTTYEGFLGDTATGTYFNFVDPNWKNLVDVPVIDVLLQVYGNGDMYNANGTGLPTTWTEGQLNSGPNYEHEGTYPLGADNGQWNWMLLEVTNPVNPATGYRYVGDPSASVQSSAGTYGGVNNGTLRLEGFADGMTIRVAAIGPQGAFGTTNQVNRFAVNSNCPPEPSANLAYIDFNQGTSNNMTILNSDNLGESLGYNPPQSGVGPQDDLRTAIQSTSGLMNFAILNNYLGQPCNGEFSMQLCVEFYDDPALAGTPIGPFQYATDAQGDLAYYPATGNNPNPEASAYVTTGTGQWLKVGFYVGPASLEGVGTAPLTGGPTLGFWQTGPSLPYVDRVELGVIQTGTNALAGQIPDPNYHLNPLICTTNYGYYAEWNPHAGVTNNVSIAGGYATALAGPPSDQRLAEVSSAAGSPGVYYFNFDLLNNVFGPALQDNADVTMLVTYYDDPAIYALDTNAQIFPNTYETLIDGTAGSTTPQAPYGQPAILQGTGKWVDAYWEIPNVNFSSGNVCRFAAFGPTNVSLYVSRIRFDVIRPCGPFEGINYLQTLGITNINTNVNVNWFGTAALQSAPAVAGQYNNVVTVTNTTTNSYTPPTPHNALFFRLQYPGYPAYLSTNTP